MLATILPILTLLLRPPPVPVNRRVFHPTSNTIQVVWEQRSAATSACLFIEDGDASPSVWCGETSTDVLSPTISTAAEDQGCYLVEPGTVLRLRGE